MLFPTLNTARLILREAKATDLDAIYKGLSNKQVIADYGIAYRSKQEAKAQLDWYEYVWQNEQGVYWIITEAATSQFLGTIGYYNWMQPNRKAETSFWLNPPTWRKGYMTEALEACLRYGFGTMQLHRVEALVEDTNQPAHAFLAKNGFAHEGTLRECELKEADDAFISLRMYGMLQADYTRP